MIRVTRSRKKTKRDDILDAGIRLFARLPFTEMTIAAVAREADCGHSLVYHYFKNINEIYDESVNYVVDLYDPFLTQVDKCTMAPELAFVGAISLLIDRIKEDKMEPFILSLISFNHRQTPYSEKLNKMRTKWFKTFLRIIEDGQKNGSIITLMSPEAILRSIVLLFQGVIGAQIFNVSAKKSVLKAADLYLPFLKGAH